MANSRICAIQGCGKPHKGLGFCQGHLGRFRKYGDPLGRAVRQYEHDCKVEGCERPGRALGLCTLHYRRQRNHGGTENPPSKTARWIEDHKGFTGNECLIWPFARGHKGYANIGGGGVTACRLMCAAAHGDSPTSEHHAAHSCGKGHLGCINPNHLSWKTPAENAADKKVHGTHLQGERQNGAKLTEHDVLKIRYLKGKASQRHIAKLYGIDPSTVSDVWTGRSWGWLTS